MSALRVLIVEDEALVAMEIEAILDHAGHQPIAQADDVASAVAAAEAQKPDLALVDMQLAQGASGLEVAAELKERGVPVLFATGNCPREVGRGLGLGCLHKPLTEWSLTASLSVAEALLRGRQAPPAPSALHLY